MEFLDKHFINYYLMERTKMHATEKIALDILSFIYFGCRIKSIYISIYGPVARLEIDLKMGLSLNDIVASFDVRCNSNTTIEFPVCRNSSFGTYNVICGPTNGQYRPILNPLMKITP